MVARIEFASGGFCEVFANAYAVYDNGNRKCVVWVPDCGNATYYFGPLKDKEKEYLDQKKELSEDDLGPLPWYNALVIAGEDRIEYNMAHPKSKGSASDTEDPAEWESKENYRWSCAVHIDGPEEAYLKKEAAEERRKALSEKQREAYVMYYEENLTVEEIAEKLGITPAAVSYRLRDARSRFEKNVEKFFS
jgi:RNA polymerase sigma factor (sigma-70 family)